MRSFIGGLTPQFSGRAAGTAIVAAMLCAALTSQAQASVIVTVWNFSTGGVAIGDPSQQALPSNPHSGDTPVATFTYNGVVDWRSPTGPTNFLDDFVGFGGGAVTGCAGTGCLNPTTLGHFTLSSAGFDLTSLFRLQFSVAGAVSGTISHDDGVSVYDATNTTQFLNSAFPTVEIASNVILPGAGAYNLWYVEANGAPSVLDVSTNVINNVPEPGTIGLLAVGLLSLFGLRLGRRQA